MLTLILCGYSLSCQVDNIKDHFVRPKYPPDVVQLCQYFEEQKSELPAYCKWGDEPKPPRRRSDF